ncbi:MAG: ParB/RepB/Spo0J family partition protein [Nitrospira sp. BO4]|jgi:ParB family chromosome partitioning protein|nr:ParB/RepB/Spo0J family partition protein [Nitrospira sp. BO4]
MPLSYHIGVGEKKSKKASLAKGTKRRRKPAGVSTGLAAQELQAAAPPVAVAELHQEIEKDEGRVLSIYREPYGGRWVVLAALPIELVAPTPYQRNLSDSHVKQLEAAIGKIGQFLDPIIAVRISKPDQAAKYWTPNGHHRLSAMRTLGARSIVAIVVLEPSAAYQILALNTEKAHNLREKALEVIRMYEELAHLDQATEDSYALEFEEPALITLGLCYKERPRFSGGAYHPVLKRVDAFLQKPLCTALDVRKRRAGSLLALDDVIVKQVEALKTKGLTSPYLKSFVVARVNPIRFRPKEAPALSFEDALDRMMQAAEKFNPDKIKVDDLAKSGGSPDEIE